MIGGRKGGGTLNGFLDRGARFGGTLTFEDTFRIDGVLKGKVVTKNELIIGDGAAIDAEIQQMTEALQQTTGKAVGGMETSRQLAGTSVEDAEAANLSLGRINEAIGAISDMATQIAAAAEEQTSVTGEISRNTENIRHVSQALAAQAGEEAAQAAQLKSLTERLEQEIGRFRL